MDTPFSSSGSSSIKLQNKLKKEKRNLSYADLHSEGNNDVNIKLLSSTRREKQHSRNSGLHNEELVKYMSKLPSYLDKGEKVKGKPLNLGVLDWHTLQNWQNYQPQMASSRYSTSSSIASSSSWTDGSSIRYGRGDTFTTDGQKEPRPSLQSYLNIPPVGHFQLAESVAGNATDCTDIKAVPSNPFDGQQNILNESLFSTKSSDTKFKECNKEHLDRQDISKRRSLKYFNKHEDPSSSKGKSKVEGDAFRKESKKLHNRYGHGIHASPDKHKDILRPRDSAESIQSCPTNLIERNGQEFKESSSTSLDRFQFGEVCNTELSPSVSDSCSLTHEIDCIKEPQKDQNISCSPSSALKSVSRATNKILKEKSSMISVDSTSNKSLKGLNMNPLIGPDSEVQNPSPSRRLSFVLNRIGRSYNSRASSVVHRNSSEYVTAKSVAERTDFIVCSNNATADQSNAVTRDRSSPIKRLLDPLLKSKVTNSKFADQLRKNSTSSRRASTSFDEEGKLASVNPVKVKSDLTNLRTTNLVEARHSKIQGSKTLQAYFQVASKNDLPLFTFAVDNNNDVLAATLRMFSSIKNDPTWIYTFFSIHETKRKSGVWLSQGSKGKDYVPNVVAQMKVTDLPSSNLGEHVTIDQLSTRKFVLYSVDSGPFDYQSCDMQANNELAAIVVKFPKRIVTCLKDSSVDVRGSSNSRDHQEDKFSFGCQELFSTIVVLPDGVHGLPCKGEPTPLIERWLSGGQCDCGGWDLGCKVKVLGNKNQQPDGQFELFSQSREEAQKMTLFTLSSLKNGIFLVEFNATLSLLQAFSICVSVFDSMQPSKLQQQSKLLEEKLGKETTLLDNFGLRTPKQVGFDIPARFASQPPHSPVGRV